MKQIQFPPIERHKKGWGYEDWIWNREFCLKLLVVYAGESMSTHYHMDKNEVWLLLEGELGFRYYDLDSGKKIERVLLQNEVVFIPMGQPHGAIAIKDCVIVEASTHHCDSDSYRIEPGSSQKKSL